MSLVVSPKTGKLVTVGSPQFAALLADPKYKDFMLNPSADHTTSASVTPSGLPPLSTSLPPLSSLSLSSPPTSPKINLPPLNGKVASPSPSLSLPPLPKSPIFSPPSPNTSLIGQQMPILPSVPKIEVSPLNTLPALKIPLAPTTNLPPLSSINIDLKLPKTSPQKTKLSPENADEILSLEFADILTLEKTLLVTTQPAKRDKIQAMIISKKHEEGRGIKTRGWAARSPTRGRERHQLKAQCGDKCFLLPAEEKFPICAASRVTGGTSKCEIECNGVESAYIRAKQYNYPDVAAKAEVLLKECNKEGLKHFTPSSPKKSPRIPLSTMRGGKMDKSPRYERKDDYLAPRRVARRNVRRAVLLDSNHKHHDGEHHERDHHERDHHERDHSHYRNMGWEPKDGDWDNVKDKKHRDWDRVERKKDKKHDELNRDEKDYTQKGDYSTIRLSPSMSRLGSMDKTTDKTTDKTEPDCGCGN